MPDLIVTHDEKRAAVAALLTRERVEYTAVFVPQSASRNSGEKQPTLNWRVTLRHLSPIDGQVTHSMALDYSQGIGHVPGYPHFVGRMTIDAKERVRLFDLSAETGRYPGPGAILTKPLPPPHAADVLHSIVMDNPHEETFECWAQELGYDTDSRKAEAIYRACIEQTRAAERVFGRAVLQELATILEDY